MYRFSATARAAGRALLPVLAVLITPLALFSAAEPDALYESFRNPPQHMRPFVRWWWNGGRVTETEAMRQVDVLQRVGIGGVEINTVAMPHTLTPEESAAFPERPWMTPEWCSVVKAASERAGHHGMTADIIVGSGWPFGGRFLPPDEQTKRVRVVKRELTGPTTFSISMQELAHVQRRGRDERKPTLPPEVVFARLVPAGEATFDPGHELGAGSVVGGQLRVDVPAGPHVLRVGLMETGFTHVKLGAPGADGPVLDHWNAKAVRHFLDYMSTGLEKTFGTPMGRNRGGPLRAAFVDSLELDHANWCADFREEFKRRRNYDVLPYLPFVLDLQDGKGETARDILIRRARYDFESVVIELFRERFMKTMVGWAHENGLLARVQAYGRETDPLDGGLSPDLPEGESWLWSDHDKIVIGPSVVNKYVGSAARIGGKRPVSFEAMTNAVPVFQETLEDFKQNMDESVMAGVHHPIFHGYNYSPPEAGAPGWVRFGCWLHERNPWWPHFNLFNDYAARLTSLLSQTEYPASIAVFGPRADELAHHSRLYQPFPEVLRPWYHYHLWIALQQAGFGNDFVSEEVLRRGTLENGRLRCGPRSYDTVLLLEHQTLAPGVAEVLAKAAESGVRIVFVGRKPERAPGLHEADKQDARVRDAVARISTSPRHALVPAPEPATDLGSSYLQVRGALPAAAMRSLLQWTLVTTHQLGIQPEVRVTSPAPEVHMVHHRSGDRRILFLANTQRTAPAELTVHVDAPGCVPWRWDPESGERTRLSLDQHGALPLHFEPLQSHLIVFEPRDAADSGPAPSWAELRLGRRPRPIRTTWNATLTPVLGEPFQRQFDHLFDFSVAVNDPQVFSFGGTVVYRAEFEWSDLTTTVLDLGYTKGITTVRLNGRELGTRWYGRHLYNASGALQQGKNVLEIELATTVANLMRARQDQPGARRYAFWFPPISAGLVGPVRLVEPPRPHDKG